MEKPIILGRINEAGNKNFIDSLDDREKDAYLVYVISIEGEEFAGADAHMYPNNKKPLLHFHVFEIGNGWEWYERQ